MQEELLYFPNVLSLTARLNTDRPETVFESKSNLLGTNKRCIDHLNCKDSNIWKIGAVLKKKKQIYGQPGHVSKGILAIINEYPNENGSTGSLYPWLHHRLKLWEDLDDFRYLYVSNFFFH